MKSDCRCVVCGMGLSGRQRRFCSRGCKNADTNSRNQTYTRQQERGLQRKLQLIRECGGRCTQCGYARNAAALTWHHLDPATRKFHLDLRSLSNRNESQVRMELAKCVLLCANCHAETHSPRLNFELLARGADRNRDH